MNQPYGNFATKVTSANSTSPVTVLGPPSGTAMRQVGYVTIVYTGTDAGMIRCFVSVKDSTASYAIGGGMLTATTVGVPGQYLEGDLRHTLRSSQYLTLTLPTAIVTGSIDIIVSYRDQEAV